MRRVGAVRARRRVLFERLLGRHQRLDASRLQPGQVLAAVEARIGGQLPGLGAEVPPDVLDRRQHRRRLVVAAQHPGVDDHAAVGVDGQHAGVVGGVPAALVGQHPRVGVGQRDRRAPGRDVLAPRPLPLQLPQPLHGLAQLRLPPPQVLEVARQPGRRRPGAEQLVLRPVRLGGLAQRPLDLRVQGRDLLLQGGAAGGVVAAVARPRVRPVQRHLVERHQPHVDPHPPDLAEQVLQLPAEAGPERADRRVVRHAAVQQPHEVDAVGRRVLQPAAGPDAQRQPVEDARRHHPRVDRRPPRHPHVQRLPIGKADPAQHLVEQPDRVIIRYAGVQRRGEEHGLLTVQWCRGPVRHRRPPCRWWRRALKRHATETARAAPNKSTGPVQGRGSKCRHHLREPFNSQPPAANSPNTRSNPAPHRS